MKYFTTLVPPIEVGLEAEKKGDKYKDRPPLQYTPLSDRSLKDHAYHRQKIWLRNRHR